MSGNSTRCLYTGQYNSVAVMCTWFGGYSVDIISSPLVSIVVLLQWSCKRGKRHVLCVFSFFAKLLDEQARHLSCVFFHVSCGGVRSAIRWHVPDILVLWCDGIGQVKRPPSSGCVVVADTGYERVAEGHRQASRSGHALVEGLYQGVCYDTKNRVFRPCKVVWSTR